MGTFGKNGAILVEVPIVLVVNFDGVCHADGAHGDETDGREGDETGEEEGDDGGLLVFANDSANGELSNDGREESEGAVPSSRFEREEVADDVLDDGGEGGEDDDEGGGGGGDFRLHADFQHVGHINHTRADAEESCTGASKAADEDEAGELEWRPLNVAINIRYPCRFQISRPSHLHPKTEAGA